MPKMKLWLTAAVLLVFAVGAGFIMINGDKPVSSTGTDGSQQNTKSVSAAEVATHRSADDCWVIIEGSVYDLTNYISLHPGGDQPIVSNCGQDGTQTFLRMPEPILAVARPALQVYFVGKFE